MWGGRGEGGRGKEKLDRSDLRLVSGWIYCNIKVFCDFNDQVEKTMLFECRE